MNSSVINMSLNFHIMSGLIAKLIRSDLRITVSNSAL